MGAFVLREPTVSFLFASSWLPPFEGVSRYLSDACDDGRFIFPKEAQSASRGERLLHYLLGTICLVDDVHSIECAWESDPR